jgi:hypothetical protein
MSTRQFTHLAGEEDAGGGGAVAVEPGEGAEVLPVLARARAAVGAAEVLVVRPVAVATATRVLRHDDDVGMASRWRVDDLHDVRTSG